ncbi:MAG: hypothetical protein HY036_01765 [Nitrospirae bacterium]|nr:hypothetical protein [Nitrospirota bacterium]MBI3351283.1 hypothetical protein [Nitrospirota bacterium]
MKKRTVYLFAGFMSLLVFVASLGILLSLISNVFVFLAIFIPCNLIIPLLVIKKYGGRPTIKEDIPVNSFFNQEIKFETAKAQGKYAISNLSESNGFSCPRCRSDNVQNLAMLVDSGTSTGRVSGIGVGSQMGQSPLSLDGREIMAFGGSTTLQTNLAKRFAPPERRLDFFGSLGFMLLLAVGWFLVVVVIGGFSNADINLGKVWLFGGFALIPILVIFLSIIEQINLIRVAPAYQKYIQKGYLCLKCGEVFQNMSSINANR